MDLRPVANYKGEIYSLPFNMWTFSKLWNITHPDQAKKIIELQSNTIDVPKNLEEQAIKLVGVDVYNKLIKGYTEKQWQTDPRNLPADIIRRLPVRFNYDNNYFNDIYQGIPIGGYTQIFNRLLENIEVLLETDYLNDKNDWHALATKVIYTGPIDSYYDYRFGALDYKTTNFIHELVEVDNYQGVAMMNYTDSDTKFTRCIEHKHFENVISKNSWITHEFPIKYIAGASEPMYPVNDLENNLKYTKYKTLANLDTKIIFGGRLAEYKYYDMHQVIESALNFIKTI